MRIGLVTDFYYPWMAGPATLLRNLGHGLAARGHSVSLLAPSPVGPSGDEYDGPMAVTRVRTVPSPFGLDLRVAPWPTRAVARWCDEFQPEVVHVHHPFPISSAAVFAARRRHIPVVATNHTIPECSLWGLRNQPVLYRPTSAAFALWLRFLLNRCDLVATPTDTASRELRALGFHGSIATISNGVDTARFAPGDGDPSLRSRLGLDDRPIVLYTGRLDAEKEMGVWLRAVAACQTKSDMQFVIGGNGADRERLEKLAAHLGLGSDVHFIGYLSESDYPSLYRLAQVYLITSPVELQSITTLEAVASGLPVVGVRAGALPELIRNGENGTCVEPGDVASLSRALDYLMNDPELRRTMGERSRLLVRNHDLDHSIIAYEQFLSRASRTNRGDVGRERTVTVGR